MNENKILEKFNELMSLPGETEIIEWKEAKNDFDFRKLGKYFTALSNEANLKSKSSAWLIFGVKNNKDIVGTFYRTNRVSLDSLKSEIAKECEPPISFIEIHEIEIKKKRIILFEIPSAPVGIPIAWKGHFYARDGESLVALSIEKIERIREQVNQKDWSKEICDSASIEDLDTNAIKKAKQGFIKNIQKLARLIF